MPPALVAAALTYYYGPVGLLAFPLLTPVFFKIKMSMLHGGLKVGGKAPDGTIVHQDESKTNLHSIQNGDRLLVINFGSFS